LLAVQSELKMSTENKENRKRRRPAVWLAFVVGILLSGLALRSVAYSFLADRSFAKFLKEAQPFGDGVKKLEHIEGLADALRYADHASRLEPDNAIWPSKRGEIYLLLAPTAESENLQLQLTDMAFQEFRQAAKLEPTNARYHFQIALFYAGYSLNTSAEENFQKALLLAPNNAYYLYHIGTFFLNAQDIDQAFSNYAKCLENDQTYLPEILDDCIAQVSDYQQYQAAIPEVPQLHLAASEYFRRKDLEAEAAKECEKTVSTAQQYIRENRDVAENHLLMARALKALSRMDESIQAYKIAISLSAKDKSPHLELAHTYYKVGLFKEALGELDVLIQDNPAHRAALTLRENIQERLGKGS
jgi:tetratricopeptide (TPR) repeat protein